MFEPPRETDPSTLDGPQYRYIHVPCWYRRKLASYRNELQRLEFDSGRILDIHYPAKGIVAMLIDKEYSKDFLETLASHNRLEPITDFGRFAAANSNDPAFTSLNDAARVAKAKELQQIRLAHGIQNMRHYLRSAIARDVAQQGFLSREQVEVILRGGSISTSSILGDIDMDSQTCISSVTSSLALHTGAGELAIYDDLPIPLL